MNPRKPSQKVNTTQALAQHLGLSRWTVSRALNGHSGVKAETVKRVKGAMDELGFSPNALARGLRGGKTGVVGICFQTFGTPVFSKKLIALQEALRKRGYRAMIELIEDKSDEERLVIRHFLSLQVEGIVFVGGPHGDNLDFVQELRDSQGLAILTIDPFTKSNLPRISLDRGFAMKISLEKLHQLGHRKIAIFGIRSDVIYGAERLASLEKVSNELGLIWGKDILLFSDEESKGMDYEAGRILGERFLRDANDCTAIMAINDQVAIGAMRVLQGNKVAIPDEVSLIGFDNLDCSSHLHPSLASIDQRIDDFTAEAIGMLQEEIDSVQPKMARSKQIQPILVEGESMSLAARIPV